MIVLSKTYIDCGTRYGAIQTRYGAIHTFHFNETSALRVDVLIPGLSSCKVFLASLLRAENKISTFYNTIYNTLSI